MKRVGQECPTHTVREVEGCVYYAAPFFHQRYAGNDLGQDDYVPFHPQFVVQGADVMIGAALGEGYPEAGDS